MLDILFDSEKQSSTFSVLQQGEKQVYIVKLDVSPVQMRVSHITLEATNVPCDSVAIACSDTKFPDNLLSAHLSTLKRRDCGLKSGADAERCTGGHQMIVGPNSYLSAL